MSQVGRVAALFACLVAPFTLNAGTAKQFVISKDPQAMAIAQTALAAMGGASALLFYQDAQASGTFTVYATSPASTYSITLKCKGTQETRVELQMPSGTNVRIVNTGQGVIEKPDGTVRHLTANNTFAERVNHIPLLSILGQYQNSSVSVQYQGTALVNGQSTSVVAVSLIPNTDPNQGPIFASMTQSLFYVDQVSGLIDKIQYTNYDENDSNKTQLVEVYLSNYRTVSGISLPFHQTTYTDGSLYSDLTISSINFNVGLPDSQFTLPQ